MKKRSIIIILGIIISFFFIDRSVWMPDRVKQLWLWERGIDLGDPIAYKQDFEIDGMKIIFKENKNFKESFPIIYHNRRSVYYLAGCYFGYLYIYNVKNKRIAVYIEK